MTEIISTLTNNAGEIITGASMIIAGGAILSKLTPTPKDDTFFGWAGKIVNVLGMNFGSTKNTGRQ